ALEADNWGDFYLSRREELKLLIHTTCGGQMQDFSDGERVPLPRQIERLKNDVGDIELRLRRLIATRVHDDWEMIPSDIRLNADKRIQQDIKDNPGINREPFDTVAGRLAYCDLRGLEQIIVNKSLWPSFSEVFKSKEM